MNPLFAVAQDSVSPVVLLGLLAGALAAFGTYRMMVNYATNRWQLDSETEDFGHAVWWPTVILGALIALLSGFAFHVSIWLGLLSLLLAIPLAAGAILLTHGAVWSVLWFIEKFNNFVRGL